MGEPAARRDKVLDLAQLAEGDVLLDVHRGSTPGGSYLAGVLTKAFRGEVLLTDAPLELDYARLSSGSDARRSAGASRRAQALLLWADSAPGDQPWRSGHRCQPLTGEGGSFMTFANRTGWRRSG